MNLLKYILFALLSSVFITGCIDRYYIEDNENIKPKVVIEGNITDECKVQEITISQSSSTEWPTFKPYSGCWVSVEDQSGMIFTFEENQLKPGYYYCDIDEQYLMVGNKFQLTVSSPDGNQYESQFEEMLPCPSIDSVYYQIEHHPTSNANKFDDGVQFYIDFEASDYFGPHYRWILEETYEYHSFWPIKAYTNEDGRFIDGPLDYSVFTCYKTNVLDQILTLSTKSLVQNSFKMAQLNFVDDYTQRLLYNYSLLVKQISLSEEAFNYWNKMKKNNKSNAGLFTKQPAMIKSNIVNIKDSTQLVLGFFSVSSVTTKRIVIPSVRELAFDEMYRCTPFFFKYVEAPLEPLPLYTFFAMDEMDNTWSRAWTLPDCVDCTLLGGTVDRPTFFE